MESVGEKIKEMRKQKQYSQRKLAELCGISNTYISDMETGRTNPSLKTPTRLSEVLEVNIKEFFD